MPGEQVSAPAHARTRPGADQARPEQTPAEPEVLLGRRFDLAHMRPGTLLRLQRASGNSAIAGLLAGTRGAPHAPVQRDLELEKLRIDGIYPDSKHEPNTVFFLLGKSELDTNELAKLEKIARAYPEATLKLFAAASEDEVLIDSSAQTVDELLTQRLDVVGKALAQSGFLGQLELGKKPESGLGLLDYRESRQVEIVPPKGTSARSVGQAARYVTGTQEHTARFEQALQVANTLLDPAIAALGKQPLDPILAALVTRFFGALDLADEIADLLGKIKAHLETNVNHLLSIVDDKPVGMPGYAIAGPGNTKYHSSVAFNTNAVTRSVMTLCAPFFKGDIMDPATTLIHEAAHAASGVVTKDHAYLHERAIEFLDEDTALGNSDSFVLLVQLFHKPDSVVVGPEKPDAVASTMSTAHQLSARQSVAWVEKWLTTAYQDVGGLYGHVSTQEKGKPLEDYYGDLMDELSIDFELSPPNEDPTNEDKVALAGIYDRLLEMRDYFVSSVSIKPGGEATLWTGATRELTVPDGFFGLSAGEQVLDVLKAVIRATPSISAGHRGAFLEAIQYTRKASGIGAPV